MIVFGRRRKEVVSNFENIPAGQTLRRRPPLLLASILLCLSACGGSDMPLSHTVELTEEFSVDRAGEVDSFQSYLQLEARLFAQLDELVYAKSPTGPQYSLVRYSKGSLADPSQHQPNWNRSFELPGSSRQGAVLLLHGMSDSPYSLRALGEKLQAQGFTVLGLRMPGHGAAPSGLTSVTWQDMSAAVRLGMEHLAHSVDGRPIHIIGYSTGAPLALDFALQAEQNSALQSPASLILISPAIGISPAAALAKWKVRLSALPGLSQIAWLQIQPEFDPYKFNSFATNAAEQVHRLTRSVADRIAARAGTEQLLPPILVFKSTVDATVTNDAVVDLLFAKLAPGRDELVLFDFNRFAASSSLLNDSTGAFTARLLEDRQLPFSLTVVANTTSLSRSVSATYKAPFGNTPPVSTDLMQKWPAGVFSLSHVALPFPPSDPLYGNVPPQDRQQLFLGAQALQGERGVLKIPADFLLRLRYNPFYDYLEQRVLDWTKPWPE